MQTRVNDTIIVEGPVVVSSGDRALILRLRDASSVTILADDVTRVRSHRQPFTRLFGLLAATALTTSVFLAILASVSYQRIPGDLLDTIGAVFGFAMIWLLAYVYIRRRVRGLIIDRRDHESIEIREAERCADAFQQVAHWARTAARPK